MKLNKHENFAGRTHEGARAAGPLRDEQLLRRSVLACLLWEDQFYEDGEEIAKRITEVAERVPPEAVAALAIEARHDMKLRHVPLLLLTVLAKTGAGQERLVADTIVRVVTRADELAEFLAIYWRDGRRPLSGQMKKGLARAFQSFDAYQLAKYDRKGPIKLRDVLFLVHAKPKDDEQERTWRRLVEGTLKSPDTWEVALSAGADKRQSFTRLLEEKKLGYLALLRNLRNMDQAEVDPKLVEAAILARRGADRVLPFRYVAAARAAPRFERALDKALRAAVREQAELSGQTIVLVDVSQSMTWAKVSKRSDMNRMQAAATLASVINGDVRVFTFSDKVVEVPARRGLAGVDAVMTSQQFMGTYLGEAVRQMNRLAHDRLIVITDEQSHDEVPAPSATRAYMINVASYENGVGYGAWTHLDGFSEGVLRYLSELERL